MWSPSKSAATQNKDKHKKKPGVTLLDVGLPGSQSNAHTNRHQHTTTLARSIPNPCLRSLDITNYKARVRLCVFLDNPRRVAALNPCDLVIHVRQVPIQFGNQFGQFQTLFPKEFTCKNTKSVLVKADPLKSRTISISRKQTHQTFSRMARRYRLFL